LGLWRSLLVSVAGGLQGFYRCGKLNLALNRVFASDSRLVQLKAGAGLDRNLPIVISCPHLAANGRVKGRKKED
jgi:hypothetical protein